MPESTHKFRLKMGQMSVALSVLFSNGVFSLSGMNPPTLIIKTKDVLNDSRIFHELRRTEAGSLIDTIYKSFNGGEDEIPKSFPMEKYWTIRLKSTNETTFVKEVLERSALVESVTVDDYMSDPSIHYPADPKISDQWYLKSIRVEEAWELSQGKGILVADIESGFEVDHSDLKHQFDLSNSYDYDPHSNDDHQINDGKTSHGTSVCGIISAESNDLFGVGISFMSRLMGAQIPLPSSDVTERVWTVLAAKAILGSVVRGAHVILIEKQLAGIRASVEASPVIHDAIKTAIDEGVPVIVPAGNFGSNLTLEESIEDSGSIVVGSTLKDQSVAPFSNFGKRVNIYAPGENIYSIDEGEGETFSFHGTSASSAIVAGVVALIRSANRELNPFQIRDILVETGVKMEGLIDRVFIQAFPAVRVAKNLHTDSN